MSSKSARRRAAKVRASLTEEAVAQIAVLDDESLKNLRFEIGREMSRQGDVVTCLRARLDVVKDEIERRKLTTVRGILITDHAIVRYLERHKGLDIETIRREIEEIALRSRQESTSRHGQRTDPESGLTLGVDETKTTVTTVFHDNELPVLAVLRPENV